ncbi:MAG: ComF family protein [Planctomycetota bacterium]|jgi:predicted amidophosphoribosyltransferase
MAIVSRRRLDQLRDWLEAVEQEWLGWSFPPVRRVLAESGWMPDGRLDYCGRCGGSVGWGEATARGCAACRDARLAIDGLVRLGPYSRPLREWVRAIKYRGWSEMGFALGRRLGAALAPKITDGGATVVVPMPMPWPRRIYRGIDHARVIASGVAAELHLPLVRVLAQANGPPQVAIPSSQRLRSTSRLRVRRGLKRSRLDGLEVVLVDDVRTTGASLKAATRLLRGSGAPRVLAAVLAAVDDRSRRIGWPRGRGEPGGPPPQGSRGRLADRPPTC